ncbi:hypothetical protein O6H91_01G099900 [Diphasiastrum complanatum]|uniref:Uncharacterized protein n=1 Tax=Diphasiastrum complanatum TaxID=34168 RepID=A0ACC2ETZ3_DIPCM|nr:hypothetical protein O6H91_01G099900 [Diphasiastrum complanatum]
MEGRNKKSVRLHFDLESKRAASAEMFSNFPSHTVSLGTYDSSSGPIKNRWSCASQKYKSIGKSLWRGVSKGWTDDETSSAPTIFDPNSRFMQNWNTFFFVTCLAAVFVDPLFIYLPFLNVQEGCLDLENNTRILVTVLRTMADTVYLLHMILQFRTAFIAPSSKVLGRGELVLDSWEIAKRYLKKRFLLDFIALLPLPQLAIWGILPTSLTTENSKNARRFTVLLLYLFRLFRIFLFAKQMVKSTGVLTETAWAGAAYNLFLYMLASHVIGAGWYWLSVQRQDGCWQKYCRSETHCKFEYLYCESYGNELDMARKEWLSTTQVFNSCSPNFSHDPDAFNFGIYTDALSNGITSSTDFVVKYLYCFWWGLRNLSTLGQGLLTGPFTGEMLFSIALAILGLILFALLIGNMQAYLQSLSVRLEEMRLKRGDAEQWMRHRRLPLELRDRVRRYEHYKWVATRGVDEQSIVQDLPSDLRREIKRHLCLELVRKVPLFNQMDDRLLDAVCERLKPALHTGGTYIIRECDPVKEMLFVIRGNLQSVTTNGGRTGFFNSGYLGPGDFCGEELLTWALHPKPSVNLPLSTRTVKALIEVEAFALGAEDLKIVAGQFKIFHSVQLQHTFKVYSQQWRTWAALYIQAAWRRHKHRRLVKLRRTAKNYTLDEAMPMGEDSSNWNLSLGGAVFASRFVSNALRGVNQRMQTRASSEESASIPKILKPEEPDFSVQEYE